MFAKHAHYLLGVGDKIGELSRWKYMALKEIEEMTPKKHQI